mgnify:CR=1 FL=1
MKKSRLPKSPDIAALSHEHSFGLRQQAADVRSVLFQIVLSWLLVSVSSLYNTYVFATIGCGGSAETAEFGNV